MTAICKMTGKETELPCSASGCPLFGDCIVEFQKERRKSKPKQTNADRIRAMSDEALCERLYHIWRNEADKGNDIAINWCDPECCSSEECDPDKHKACILRWLQRPAEDTP